ncbi:MucR family transcriptional regulator [Brevundimonas lutea]|uniref:MucR family transcriptional regulator n=1 Tax=Brevundimonas lutea TaxID=2293980 RepID=UPI000F02E6A5|nr:MucR family transcriptional regulator [Brevundimonas lutea]
MQDDQTPNLINATADIVIAYVSNNKVEAGELPGLISSIHASLGGLGQPVEEPAVDETKSRAEIRRSITDEALISFLDGKPYRTLKRHLTTKGMTPDEYRTRFGLGADYPMVHPTYSARRSELAKSIGLGARGRGAKSAPASARGRKKTV